ncbi:MAG TPA: tetratricopeptide repeat protein, partial [Methylomirabilota bacterium]
MKGLTAKGLTAAVCLVSVVLLGAAPAGLPPDMRERFTAAVDAHRAGDWTAAAREFGDAAWIGTPLEDYALLFRADSLLRRGETAEARSLATRATDRTPESGLSPSALIWAAAVQSAAGDPGAAVRILERVLGSHPDRLDASRTRYLLGEAQLATGDQPAAAKTFAALWLQA